MDIFQIIAVGSIRS